MTLDGIPKSGTFCSACFDLSKFRKSAPMFRLHICPRQNLVNQNKPNKRFRILVSHPVLTMFAKISFPHLGVHKLRQRLFDTLKYNSHRLHHYSLIASFGKELRSLIFVILWICSTVCSCVLMSISSVPVQ